FVEVSAHPVLVGAVEGVVEEAGGGPSVVVGTLRRGDGGMRRLLCSMGELWVRGVGVDWGVVFEGSGARRVGLPTYAFQRQRHWLTESAGPAPAAGGTDPRFWDAADRDDTDLAARELALTDPADRAALSTVLPALAGWHRRQREQARIDSWRYRVTWTPLADPPLPRDPGTWAVLVPDAGLAPPGTPPHPPTAATLLGRLTALGVRVLTIPVGPADLDRQDLARLLRRHLPDDRAPDLLLSLLALLPGHHPGLPVLPSGLGATLALVQAVDDLKLTIPLWCATSGAVSPGGADPDTDPAQTAVWGLGRVAALEHPGRWGGLVDLPATVDDPAARRLVALLRGDTAEDQVAVRASGALARRLEHAPAPRDRPERPWRPRGTVLITGGTGGVAAHVARWLARNGAEHLVLAGRRGAAAEGATALADDLTALGAGVTFAACDIADPDSVARLIEDPPGRPPLTAVVHAAGVARQSPLAETGMSETADVLAAKAAGAAHLDRLLGDRDLDAFVLFSSNAAVWGSGTQAAYAAANAYLDGLAERRRARGRAATSIAWGAWDGGGMSTFSADVRQGLERSGLVLMEPETAVRALAQAVGDPHPCLAITDMDWDRFAPRFTSMRPSPLLDGLPEVRALLDTSGPATADAEHGGAARELAARLAGLPPAERRRVLLDLVRTEAAAVLGHAGTDAVAPGRAFGDMGFDSLTAVELRNRLIAASGAVLPATVVFDHPSPTALADLLHTELATTEAGTPPVLAELDALAAALAAADPAPDLRARIAERLRSLTAGWEGGSTPNPGNGTDLDLDAATDDEMFQFIDSEFGPA
ncbi:SDR family NAD(P)-dependent oxidoreductase, partial [Nocardiopsis mangrovi]